VEEHEVELAIGDTLYLGNRIFTVIDIEGEEISFRVELVETLTAYESEPSLSDDYPGTYPQFRPR
jgi:hypothetical protein